MQIKGVYGDGSSKKKLTGLNSSISDSASEVRKVKNNTDTAVVDAKEKIATEIPKYNGFNGSSVAKAEETAKEPTKEVPTDEGTTKTYSFTPSKTYLDAMAYTQSLLDKLSSGRTSYTDKINDIMAQIEGREAFSYDFNTDTLFQQQLQSAMQSGKLAMQDTMGQASALTGGYGSTYSQAVGNQAYNAQIQGAYDSLPEYYGLALDAYNAEGNALATKLGMYQTADEAEYSRLANAYSANAQANANLYDQEYNNYWQGVSAQQNVANSLLENQQFYDKLAAQYGVGFDANGNAYTIDSTKTYEEPSTTQYSKALDAYNTSPTEFYKYLDSLPSDTDVDKIMEYVTQHGNADMSLAYTDWQNGEKDTFNWFGGIDNNDKVTVTNADGTVTTLTLKQLYDKLVDAGMSREDAKTYVMQYNGNK